MFKSKPLAALVALACTQAAMANPPVTLDEVVVTATRTATPVAKVLSDITVLGSEEIAQSGSVNLPDLLSRQTGIDMVSNGGEGTEARLSLRGSRADHVMVLIDGVRIVSGTKGTTSLEHIPLALIERVEILRGPASSLYGADAMGGVIQIFTKRGTDSPALRLHAGVGAEGKRVAGAGLAGKVDRTAFSLAVDHNHSDGFSARPLPYNRDRDGYENTTYTANLQHELAPGHTVGLNAYHADAVSEYDSTSSGVAATQADEGHSQMSAQSIELKNRINTTWHSTLRFNYSTDKSQTYTKSNFLTPSGTFDTRLREWQWQNDLQLGQAGQLTLGAANVEQFVHGSAKMNQRYRRVDSVFAAYQGEFGIHRLQGSTRFDDNSQFGGKTTGQLAYGMVLSPAWSWRAAYGTAIKAPTFNQLYWPGVAPSYRGNPDLQPETASTRELGLTWQQAGQYAKMVAFDHRIDNMIANKSATDSLQVNLDRARILGESVEVGTVIGEISLAANVTSQRARDVKTGRLLAARAKRFGGMTLGWQLDRTLLSAEWRASSKRVVDAGKNQYLPGYGVVNLGADYQLDKQWTLNTKLTNVGDKRYETVKDYNQPRRGWFVGVRYAQ